MFALVSHITFHPLQILGPETYHAVAGLPDEQLPVAAEFDVDLVRRHTFELSNELADRNGRGDGKANMNVSFGAAHLVDVNAGGVHTFSSDGMVGGGLDGPCQQRGAPLRVPD